MIPLKDTRTMTTLPKSRAAEASHNKAMPNPGHAGSEGFGLVESMMAVLILALGFMYVGPMMFNAVESTTLARSQSTAGLAATQRLEILALKYRANASDADLTAGDHGPVQVEIVNPSDNSKMNRYNVAWTVGSVPDPRAGKVLKAVRVTVTVTPIGSGTSANVKNGQNKVTQVTTIFSLRNSS
jgi:Tfp pilus assembly protein PilV